MSADTRERLELETRFEANVCPEPNTGCFLWTGSGGGKPRHWYGMLRVAGRSIKATHVAWLLRHGAWPELHVLHRCDTSACVNPGHLFQGTHLDNMRDMSHKLRAARQTATHCVNGHEFTPENTKIRRGGWRACRACLNARNAAWKRQRQTGVAQ